MGKVGVKRGKLDEYTTNEFALWVQQHLVCHNDEYNPSHVKENLRVDSKPFKTVEHKISFRDIQLAVRNSSLYKYVSNYI